MLPQREFSSLGWRFLAALALACTLAPLTAAGKPVHPVQELAAGRLVLDATPLPPTSSDAGEPIVLPDPWSVNRPAANGIANACDRSQLRGSRPPRSPVAPTSVSLTKTCA